MKTRKEKEKLVKELKEKFASAGGYILVSLLNFDILSQKKLRDFLKENNSFFEVVKKTLIYKAYPQFPFKDEEIKLPFGLIWNFDQNLSSFQALKNLKKEGVEIDIVGGYLEGRKLNTQEVLEIINLPSKEELTSKLYFALRIQLSKLVFDLKYPLNKLVLILSQIKK